MAAYAKNRSNQLAKCKYDAYVQYCFNLDGSKWSADTKEGPLCKDCGEKLSLSSENMMKLWLISVCYCVCFLSFKILLFSSFFTSFLITNIILKHHCHCHLAFGLMHNPFYNRIKWTWLRKSLPKNLCISCVRLIELIIKNLTPSLTPNVCTNQTVSLPDRGQTRPQWRRRRS